VSGVFTFVDATRIQVFREVVTRGSFTAAAAALRISQPAVSQHIAKLEQEIGAALLVRAGRSLRITAPGQVLLRRTNELLSQLRDTADELAAITAADSGELRVVAFPSAASTIVPPVIGALRRLARRVTVTMTEADPAVALPALLAGQYDLALAYEYPMLGAPRDVRLRWQVLAEDAMAVALPATHPLAGADQVPLGALAGADWVAPHPCACREALDLSCRRSGFTPNVVSQTNDYQATLGLVAAEVGVAVVPRLIAALGIPAGVVLRPLPPSRFGRTVAAVTGPTEHRPPIRQRMLQLLQSMIGGLAHPDLPLGSPAG
jgi:DNA-binding transcriptional LysR family regulator